MLPACAQQPLVMGIVNVTPDSFSDGGLYLSADAAISHGMTLIKDGADIIDVGGESTRPGADRVSPNEEQKRVLPIIEALASTGAVISVDTMNSATASAALAAGATIINDVSGGLADELMPKLAADADCGFIAMHWRGHSRDMQQRAVYSDVVSEVVGELKSRIGALVSVGIKRENLAIDPGLGFAKEAGHNWEILRQVDRLKELQLPVLIGASRKRFLTDIVGNAERDTVTAEISLLMAMKKIWAIRVHDVAGTVAALRLAERLQ